MASFLNKLRTTSHPPLCVVIRGLPLETEQEDIVEHIQSLSPCHVTVGSVIPDFERGSCLATVTLTGGGSDDGKSLLDLLNHTQFLGQPEYRIYVEKDFYGLTTVAEHVDSTIDFCFVHGLGGHAFHTWTSSKDSGNNTSMWPRDFLPERFQKEGIKARFLTYGHRANVIKNADARATIRTAAEALLGHLIAHRSKDPTRPIYFACHSLGGLIVCEALINCLSNDVGFAVKKPDYETLFSSYGNCFVGGIIFFGCPFRGSSQANYIYPFIKLLSEQSFNPVNKALVQSLKSRDIGVAQIVGRFNRVRKSAQIPLLICYETDPVVGTSLTTSRDSAMSAFDRDVAPIQIIGNHHNMVKFSHREDQNYRVIEDRIVQMVKSQSAGLVSPTEVRSHPLQSSSTRHQRGSSDSSLPLRGSSTRQYIRPIIEDHSKYARLSMFDTVFIIDDTGSMQKSVSLSHPDWFDRWSSVTRALECIADITAKHDRDGVDLFFLKNTDIKGLGLKSGDEVLRMLKRINLSDPICGGGTFFREQLMKVIEPCIEKFRKYKEHQSSGVELPKPLNLIVLTDGEAEDEQEVEEYLVNAARRLDEMEAPRSQIGVQFVQIGDDVEAAEYLRRLDDDLKLLHKNSKGEAIRDMVDTTPFEQIDEDSPDTMPGATPQSEQVQEAHGRRTLSGGGVPTQRTLDDPENHVLKIVLGAVTKRLDDLENPRAFEDSATLAPTSTW